MAVGILLVRFLAALERGPVLLRAFRRLAAIRRSLAMVSQAARLRRRDVARRRCRGSDRRPAAAAWKSLPIVRHAAQRLVAAGL